MKLSSHEVAHFPRVDGRPRFLLLDLLAEWQRWPKLLRMLKNLQELLNQNQYLLMASA